MLSFKINQNGNAALLVVVIGAAISVTIMAGLTGTFVNANRLAAAVKSSSQANAFMDSIQDQLSAPELCGVTFANFNYGAVRAAGGPVNVQFQVPSATGNVNFGANATIDNSFYVQSVTMTDLTSGPGVFQAGAVMPTVTNAAGNVVNLVRRVAEINVSLAAVVGEDRQGTLKPHTFKMAFMTDVNTQTVVGCATETGEGDACSKAGNIFNPASFETGLRCVPFNYCRVLGSYSSGNNGFPNPFMLNTPNPYSCPPGSREVKTGSNQAARSRRSQPFGFKFYGSATDVYSCMVCGAAATAAAPNYQTREFGGADFDVTDPDMEAAYARFQGVFAQLRGIYGQYSYITGSAPRAPTSIPSRPSYPCPEPGEMWKWDGSGWVCMDRFANQRGDFR